MLIDGTGEPLVEASIFVEGYRGPVSTDSLGNFAVIVPVSGDVVLVARRIGYQTVRLPIRMDAGPVQMPIVIRLETMAQVEEEWRARLMTPTSVTPCRPADARAAGEGDAIRRFLNSGDATIDSLVRTVGLVRFLGAAPEHVIDRNLCGRAAEAINEKLEAPDRGTQVHLYRLRDVGFAAYDPSIPAGEWQITYFLDPQLRVITGVVW